MNPLIRSVVLLAAQHGAVIDGRFTHDGRMIVAARKPDGAVVAEAEGATEDEALAELRAAFALPEVG